MLTLGARLIFLKRRNIAQLTTKELIEMSQWNTYQRNPFTNAKEVIGETLEYLNHEIKDSAYHAKFNPNNDKKYAVIQCVKHDDTGMSPLSVTISSAIVLEWLNNIDTILVKGRSLMFRFTYDETAKSGEPKWGIEYMLDSYETGEEYTEPEL